MLVAWRVHCHKSQIKWNCHLECHAVGENRKSIWMIERNNHTWKYKTTTTGLFALTPQWIQWLQWLSGKRGTSIPPYDFDTRTYAQLRKEIYTASVAFVWKFCNEKVYSFIYYYTLHIFLHPSQGKHTDDKRSVTDSCPQEERHSLPADDVTA